MTARIVWLVANDLVRPEEVLGLTFTRKAAGELADRVTARLDVLRSRGVVRPADPADDLLGGTPTISTYHSYAGSLVREHAMRLGHEPDSRLLAPAAAWQYAHEVVRRWEDPLTTTKVEASVTAAVVSLAGSSPSTCAPPRRSLRGSTTSWPTSTRYRPGHGAAGRGPRPSGSCPPSPSDARSSRS